MKGLIAQTVQYILNMDLSPTNRMIKKRAVSQETGRQRALDNKSWEADILRQINITKSLEKAALLQELEFKTLTQESRKQELFLLLKLLDLKVNRELSEARAYEAKVHESTCVVRSSERRARYLLRLRKSWYLDKAQEHRNRAEQFSSALDELEVLFLQCSASLRQICLQKSEILRKQEPKMNLVVTSPANSSCISDMMRIAMHNNLLAHLQTHRTRTAQQQASSVMYRTLCLQQQERTANLQIYYSDLKISNEIR